MRPHRRPDPFWGHAWTLVVLGAFPPARGAEASLWRCWRCHELRPGYLMTRTWCPAQHRALPAGEDPRAWIARARALGVIGIRT